MITFYQGNLTLDIDNQEVEKLKEIILQGVKSIGTVTELISQLVYEEDKRRSQFKDILKMVKNLLESNSHKTHTIARQYGRKYPPLTGPLARMFLIPLLHLLLALLFLSDAQNR